MEMEVQSYVTFSILPLVWHLRRKQDTTYFDRGTYGFGIAAH
jgi:hypothetical protein